MFDFSVLGISSFQLFSIISFAISLYAFLTMYREIKNGDAVPHVFTWSIRAIMHFITACILFKQDVVNSALIFSWFSISCVLLVRLSLKKEKPIISKKDIICLVFSLSIIPVWLYSTEWVAMILVMVINALLLLPTAFKVWLRPHTEPLKFYMITYTMFIFTFLSVEVVTYKSMAMPVFFLISEGIFFTYLVFAKFVKPAPVIRIGI